MELKDVLWTHHLWPQEAELFPHFVDLGCSLRELHSLEARILSCVAGREWFSPAHIRGPWESQTERPLYSRPSDRAQLAASPASPSLTWCLFRLAEGAHTNYPKKKKNWVSKDSRGEVKKWYVLLKIESESGEHKGRTISWKILKYEEMEVIGKKMHTLEKRSKDSEGRCSRRRRERPK